MEPIHDQISRLGALLRTNIAKGSPGGVPFQEKDPCTIDGVMIIHDSCLLVNLL